MNLPHSRPVRSIRTFFVAAFGVVGCAATAQVTVQREGGQVVMSGRGWRAVWSQRDGGLTRIEVAPPSEAAPHVVVDDSELWKVRFADGSSVTSSGWLRPPWNGQVQVEAAPPDRLRSVYRSGEFMVEVRVRGSADGFDLVVHVANPPKRVLHVDLPARLQMPVERIQRMIFSPSGGDAPGIALNRSFFQRHTGERSVRWENVRIGSAGYELLFGGPLRQLADDQPVAPLQVTDEGRQWFLPGTIRMIEGSVMCINRPPASGQADLVLVDSPDGPALCGASLGGRGLLMRFTGKGDPESPARRRTIRTMVVQAIGAYARRHPDRFKGRQVCLISLKNGPERGGWTGVTVAEWMEALGKAPWLVQSGARFAVLQSRAALEAALDPAETAVILNPYGEWLPTERPGSWRTLLARIRDFVRDGGMWWEVGGYPFYYELVRKRNWFDVMGAQYPAAVADFVYTRFVDGAGFAVFGVQPLMRRPWDLDRLITPAEFQAGGDDAGAFFRHAWHICIEAGRTWQSPPLRFLVEPHVREALERYREALELRRTLADKVRPDLLEKLRSAVLVRLGGATAQDQIEALPLLPPGSLVHFTEYLHGGFDKQYPDHLPPLETWGTPDDLRRFYEEGHRLGHLMMPYTNTSWWCVGPKGPTFRKAGTEPLARTRDGKFITERYGTNEGRRICFWHPAVQAAHRRVRRQMTREYPSDVLFQDQVGARGWSWDYNPAAPNPTAWISGLLSLSMEDAAAGVPLATENGYDRVADFETMLCGMGWAVVPSGGRQEPRRYVHRFSDGDWDVWPVLGFLAHERVLFTLHDLGHFVIDPERQAWTVGLGFSMSFACALSSLENPVHRRWLFWLDAVQKTLGRAYAGRRLAEFAVRANPAEPDAACKPILASAYDGGVTVLANVGRKAFSTESGVPDFAARLKALTPPGARIAGPGFFGAGPETAAGRMVFGHADNGNLPAGFTIKRSGPRRWGGAVFGADGVSVRLPLVGAGKQEGLPRTDQGRLVATIVERFPVREQDDSPPVETPCRVVWRGGVAFAEFRLSSSVRAATGMPDFAGRLPPGRWPEPAPRTIAVLALKPELNGAWVGVKPEDWLTALRNSTVLSRVGFRIVPVRRPEELLSLLNPDSPDRAFAVVNPYGERFPAASEKACRDILDRIRRYVRNGGVWIETGGYSFYICATPVYDGNRIVGWKSTLIGPGGAGRIGFACGGYAVEEPPLRLEVTPDGLRWLGAERARSLDRAVAGVQRPFVVGQEDLVLVKGATRSFLAATRLDGWGWLWRLGGFNPPRSVAVPAVVGVLEYLAQNPWPKPRPRSVDRLWSVRISAYRE